MKTGRITWQSPSNIALVKYWGKKPVQIPANPNLSITLSRAYTEMEVEFGPARKRKGQTGLEFWFEDRKQPEFERKIARYIDSLKDEMPFLQELYLRIRSRNTFPHSAGIASSASSMSALGLCLASLYSMVQEKPLPAGEYFRFASRLSRLASGSACRSVYGGYTIWGRLDEFPETSDEYAVPVPFGINPVFSDMRDAILVVSSKVKEVSSRTGHSLMEGHPYADARYRMARSNLLRLAQALQTGDVEEFMRITEQEALNLHGLMMSSDKSYLLFEPNTVNIVNAVRRFRKESNIPACFTLDAGPNVHVLYPARYEITVKKWISDELVGYLENNNWIDDAIGTGPVSLNIEH